MISISRYFNQREPDENSALRRALSLLFQIIDIHAVRGDDADYAQFRSSVGDILARFSDQTPQQEILIIVGEVATALKDYSERTTRYIKAQGLEYQRMVAMLADTIAKTTHASETSVERLLRIEKKLEKTSVIEDMRVIRMQLAECLEAIREEIKSQHDALVARGQTGDVISHPNSHSAPTWQSETADAITGLPGRPAAETALVDAFQSNGTYYAVPIIANRIDSINTRFGYAVGDRVLRRIAERLRAGLSADDRLFRWCGPAFLALLLRAAAESEVKKEVTRIAGTASDELVEIGNRSVLLSISASWAVFPLNEPVRIVRDKVDHFIRLHV